MDKEEILDEIWDISKLLERKSKEIEIDGLYMNMKDIAQDLQKFSERVMNLWENLDEREVI